MSTIAVTVLLTNEQAARLDEVSTAIRRTVGQSIRRSALIRATLTSALKYHEDWADCRSETEVRETFAERLRVGETV